MCFPQSTFLGPRRMGGGLLVSGGHAFSPQVRLEMTSWSLPALPACLWTILRGGEGWGALLSGADERQTASPVPAQHCLHSQPLTLLWGRYVAWPQAEPREAELSSWTRCTEGGVY